MIDGGLATSLQAAGHDLTGPLWSARLLAHAPDAVRAAHLAFARAGADVLTTATYQAAPGNVADVLGLDGAGFRRLVADAVRLAREAGEQAADGGRARLVAGSLGPWGAVLADGSEYTGAYAGPGVDGLSVRDLRRRHRPRIAALVEAGADVIAAETLPCLAEVEAFVAELAEAGVAAWVSLTAVLDADGVAVTRRGEPLAEAFAMAAHLPGLVAAGVNCCDPAVVPAVAALARDAGVRLVAYPNAGPWDGATATWRAVPDDRWADDVAGQAPGLLGGCCGVGPAGIARLAAALTVGGAR